MANEKRLIDANDVYALFDKNGFARLHVGDIDTIPRVDAVEVVRCAKCKRCMMCYPEKQIGKEATPGWYCKEFKGWRRPDDFCSYGERRTDGQA